MARSPALPPLLLLCSCERACAVGSTVPGHQLSVEALPSTTARPDLDRTAMDYGELQALADDVMTEVAPDIIQALGWADQGVELSLSPGGYLGETTPAMQIRISCSDADASRFAAAFGLVLVADSALVMDWTDGAGDTAWASVRFLDGPPEGALADAFFDWAIATEPALEGGYTGFGETITFLNLRGADGLPYSALEDQEFVDAVERAASTWTEGGVVFEASGLTQAWRVENDWSAAPSGETYADALGEDPALSAALQASAEEAEDLVNAAAEDGGW